MTPEEHDQLQTLIGTVKRYRRRIVELKAQIAELEKDKAAREVEDEWNALEPPDDPKP